MRRLVPLVAAIGLACVPAAAVADTTRVAVFYDGAFYKSGETVWQSNRLADPDQELLPRLVLEARVRIQPKQSRLVPPIGA